MSCICCACMVLYGFTEIPHDASEKYATCIPNGTLPGSSLLTSKSLPKSPGGQQFPAAEPSVRQSAAGVPDAAAAAPAAVPAAAAPAAGRAAAASAAPAAAAASAVVVAPAAAAAHPPLPPRLLQRPQLPQPPDRGSARSLGCAAHGVGGPASPYGRAERSPCAPALPGPRPAAEFASAAQAVAGRAVAAAGAVAVAVAERAAAAGRCAVARAVAVAVGQAVVAADPAAAARRTAVAAVVAAAAAAAAAAEAASAEALQFVERSEPVPAEARQLGLVAEERVQRERGWWGRSGSARPRREGA
uniref:Uncharacterized protein n=1 Tax=Blyttiomyces helicus TaxID=388810 RepID=A0A4P9WCI0_9FUNG|nr:hypothetical protein BDK51DRAFT_48550 [Blyttiomyces helicus]|eukprot:RKO88066.1 hypothetical protein BDK51DRAFT_48550 [Blyttiomyces helicus]